MPDHAGQDGQRVPHMRGIFSITDLKGGILIKEADYTYPLYLYDISRAEIGRDHGRARALHRQYIDK